MFEATLARRPMPIEGSGKQVRPMTYVADAIDGLLTVARRRGGALEPIDIVSTDEPSAIEIARTLARGVGRDFVYEYVSERTPSVDHNAPGASDHVAFGVPPATSLEAGLRKTYDWFSKESNLFV
jgi:nucleoside-diphosphate-sugar epimerase